VVERRGAQPASPQRRQRGRPARFAPHQLRHAHALELARQGVPLNIIQRQLGHYVGDRRSPRPGGAHIIWIYAGDRAAPPPRDHPHIQHANLGTTSIYLQRIDPEEIIAAVRTRRAPMISASAGLRL
jgi:Phage integrase family